MQCGSDIGKRCMAAELDGKGLEGVSPDTLYGSESLSLWVVIIFMKKLHLASSHPT